MLEFRKSSLQHDPKVREGIRGAYYFEDKVGLSLIRYKTALALLFYFTRRGSSHGMDQHRLQTTGLGDLTDFQHVGPTWRPHGLSAGDGVNIAGLHNFLIF